MEPEIVSREGSEATDAFYIIRGKHKARGREGQGKIKKWGENRLMRRENEVEEENRERKGQQRNGTRRRSKNREAEMSW